MASIKKIINQFNSSLSEKFSLSTPVNILWKEYKSMFLECLDHVPTRSNTIGMKQLWITPHIKRLSCKKQSLYNQAKLLDSPHHWDTYQSSKKENVIRLIITIWKSYSTRTVP